MVANRRLHVLGSDPLAPFPPAAMAMRDPNGLLAVGGDLTPTRLLRAYREGIFPWFSDGQPVLWWSPDPRIVFDVDRIRLSRRLRRQLRTSQWILRADTAFGEVIDACAHIARRGESGTWINQEMQAAYRVLHDHGHAHSVEVFDGPRLVGGLYGVAIGRMFFGESMFSAQSGGSKVALAGLAHRLRAWGWPMIDAQVENPHLLSLGARSCPRDLFLQQISELTTSQFPAGRWTGRFGALAAAELVAVDPAP